MTETLAFNELKVVTKGRMDIVGIYPETIVSELLDMFQFLREG